MELFSKSSPGAQKDEISTANVRPKVNSSILGAVGLGQAFNQAKNHEFNGNISSEKQAVIKRAFQEKLKKVYSSEVTESSDQTDTSDNDNSSDSDETESSDSSITRVEQVKNKIKTGSKLENLHKNSIEVDKRVNTADQTSKKARAKVSANMIISDFNSFQLQSKNHQEQYGNSSLTSPTAWIETSNESGLNNVVRRPRVKVSTTSEENAESASFQYKKSNIVDNQPRKVSFDSNSDATLRSDQTYARSDARSDVSWGSDPGKSHDSNTISFRQSKIRTTNPDFGYQNDNYTPYQLNPRYNSTLSNNQKNWSDVTYNSPTESRTVVSHHSDPGPRRKISVSAQLNINNDVEDYEEDNTADADQELEELISMSSNPKIQRKFLDLKIANKSLLTLNATLEETIKKQSSNLNTFESVTDVQQLQLDHMTKVEELMRELSVKITSQELEIKNLKNKLEEDNSEQQQKVSQLNMNNKPNENYIFKLGKILILALLYGILFNLNFEYIWNLLKSLEYLYSMIQETSQ